MIPLSGPLFFFLGIPSHAIVIFKIKKCKIHVLDCRELLLKEHNTPFDPCFLSYLVEKAFAVIVTIFLVL